MSAESEDIHAQKSVCGDLACRCTVMFCLGILVKKLAHTHGFEHEPSGLKSKHLTTGPRTPELCDLRAETIEWSRGKSTRTFP